MPLDVEARPSWRPLKPVWASDVNVFVAVTLALFADDICLTAAFVMINTQPSETKGIPHRHYRPYQGIRFASSILCGG